MVLRACIPDRVIAEISDTLFEDLAGLMVEERRFHGALQQAFAPGAPEPGPHFRQWAHAQARQFQKRHRKLARAWQRCADQLHE